MPETLLSPSGIVLFGRKVADLRIVAPDMDFSGAPRLAVRAATTGRIDLNGSTNRVDGVALAEGDRVLVKDQGTGERDPAKRKELERDNGVYVVPPPCNGYAPWQRAEGFLRAEDVRNGFEVAVEDGGTNRGTSWILTTAREPFGEKPIRFSPKPVRDPRHGPFVQPRRGRQSELEGQLDPDEDPCFARIYGFSFEGVYYDLVTPSLFLVHGEGAEVSDPISTFEYEASRSRAPGDTSRTGVSITDFQFTEGLRAWSYDKADYSIRMDVASGMFEQLLLGPELDDDPVDAFVSGQRARVSGQRARVSGQRARVSGQRARARDRGD